MEKQITMALKYGVIGTGALGGYYGGKLAYAGNDVHFLLRSDYQHVKEKGLQVDSVAGDFHLKSVSCYSSTNEMPVCDVVLVCLKTTQNDRLPDLLKPILHENTVVVLIQNGLGLEESLDQKMPNVSIAGGLAFICSQKAGLGYVQHLDLGKLVLGMHSSQGYEVLETVCSDFQRAGVPCQLSDNLAYSRWQKLVWNVPFNGLTVVMNTTTDQLVEDESTRQLALDMMLEVVQAANECGHKLDPEFAHKMLAMTLKMKPYAPSMKLDYDFKRLMEIEAIYTSPIRTALEAGYKMNKVTMLEKQLRFIQEQQRLL